jgi:hypothetical protein
MIRMDSYRKARKQENEVDSDDYCRCGDLFTEHTRKIGVSPYVASGHTDMACTMCGCGDFIPTPYTQMNLGFYR